ncbi:hypothetical protein GJ699_02790 [Duganella sp. FT80W]|uniref:DUF2622 domain-containing protein n=1 Tax=Duganella guangzhouensis TaxID=2666084 RepID=A0A6I2KTZ5_9BURK|nr:hypothetical protein [Duganella guangzhouensis]MRW88902.1 hypothetical protein [Duganella guangzhouensis]
MLNYIIRVAYAAPQADTHDRLKLELAKFNVAGAIKADDGKGYFLPEGEFCYSGNETINDVRDAVFRLASTIQPEPSILVVEVTTLSWAGLKLIETA